ncbi:MAG: four helix bundle protein [Ruminococcaceae bacterium]|nr:four helix bundle protein [Oscillospiraceae bacterium]
MTTYRDLMVWQKSMDLVDEVYALLKLLPKEETYALADQMRRSVVSIPSNIAEGYDRNTTKDYVHFLMIARGSKSELETQLIICVRQGMLTQKQVRRAFILCTEIGKMLNSIKEKLN